MGLESFDVVRFDLGAPPSRSNKDSKSKSAYKLLIIGPRGLQYEVNLWEIMGWESNDVVRFDLGPLLQGPTRMAKVKSVYNSLYS